MFWAPIAIHYYSRLAFLSLHTNGVLGQISICSETVFLGLAWHLAALDVIGTPTNCNIQKFLPALTTLPWWAVYNHPGVTFQTLRTQTWIRHCSCLDKQTCGSRRPIWKHIITICHDYHHNHLWRTYYVSGILHLVLNVHHNPISNN